MLRYIILIILMITLFSLFALFEKPAVNHYSHKQKREFLNEEALGLKEVKETPQFIYIQSDMDFLMDAYNVGNS